jgi:hypothetical protein
MSTSDAPGTETRTRRERPLAEVRPPSFPTCPHCGSDDTVFSHSKLYREFGLRRVTHTCRACNGGMWWDERLRVEARVGESGEAGATGRT